MGTLTFDTLDGVRALLTDVGIVVHDEIVEKLRDSTMTLVHDVEMPQAFIDQHGL